MSTRPPKNTTLGVEGLGGPLTVLKNTQEMGAQRASRSAALRNITKAPSDPTGKHEPPVFMI